MYVTRRLLRSTLEETTAVKQEPIDAKEEAAVVSPSKRRPLVRTHARQYDNQQKPNKCNKSNKSKLKQSENQADKPDKSGKRNNAAAAALRGMGLLIDARDSQERWCEAKILDLNVATKSVYIHYVGWNTRYDCWLEAKYVAAHGSHTKAKPKRGSSWNGKDSLISDPTIPENPTKSTSTIPTLVTASTSKKTKAHPVDDKSNIAKISNASTSAKASKKAFNNRANITVKVADEESDQKTRRGSYPEKIDLELDMDIQGDATNTKPPTKSTPTNRAPTSNKSKPPPISTTKSPTAMRKPSPRGEKNMKDEPATVPLVASLLQSPTVGMSALRRSARAARETQSKKRKKNEDDDSDEEYKEDEDEEEEEDDDEEDEEEEEHDSEEEDVPIRHTSSSSGKTRRVSSSTPSAAPWRSGHAVITQWQTDPAYVTTRDRLSTIFRHRVHQRGELHGDFQGSFQLAMSGSSAASTPRSLQEDASASKSPDTKPPKKKKAKTAQRVMDDEEKAAAAQYYYGQHYYHMQAYQYHQQMYQQALMVQQLEHQQRERLAAAREKQSERATAGDVEEKEEKHEEEKEDGDGNGEAKPPTATETENHAPMMNGGIIDPRFIHARMDALEHQKRIQLYYQHYAQATERNLQMLAATPEFLNTSANLWRQQMQNGGHPPTENKPATLSTLTAADGDGDVDMEEKRPVEELVDKALQEKHDETRRVENAGDDVAKEATRSASTTPEATPEATENLTLVADKASNSYSEGKETKAGTATRGQESAQASPSKETVATAQSEAVLFELAL